MTGKNCDCGMPAVEQLDGEWLCSAHADEWLAGERRSFAEWYAERERGEAYHDAQREKFVAQNAPECDEDSSSNDASERQHDANDC